MCGRYALDLDHDELMRRYSLSILELDFAPRYNIAPTQTVPIVISTDGEYTMVPMRWGMVPSWAKDASIGNKMINARGETVHEKPSFRKPFRSRRCLVPATGYYEWRKPKSSAEKTKTPYYFTSSDHRPFSFAGLWDQWTDPNGAPVNTFTIITTEPNDLVRPIHNRMPVILGADDESRWMDHSTDDVAGLRGLLVSCPPEQIVVYEVSRLVNSPRNDTKDCISPAG